MKDLNGYNLTRTWYNYKFENPSTVKAKHSDMYFYILDLWNRLGQKKEFGLPTSVTMELLQIGSYNTYKNTLSDLVEFGFIKVVKTSVNQYQSKVIALSKIDKATDKPLDKAHNKATDKAPDDIDKQLTKNKEQVYRAFDHLSITKKQHTKLITSYSLEQVEGVYDAIENYAKNKTYKSLYLTSVKWLQRDEERSKPVFTDPSLRNPYKDLGK